jgi:hypothetical protein
LGVVVGVGVIVSDEGAGSARGTSSGAVLCDGADGTACGAGVAATCRCPTHAYVPIPADDRSATGIAHLSQASDALVATFAAAVAIFTEPTAAAPPRLATRER